MNLVYNENIKSFDLHNIYQYVENKYSVFVLNSVKEFVKISKRIEKCKNDIFFLTTCLQNGVLPNFTSFRTTNNRLKGQPVYKTCRKLLLTTELSNHKSDLKKLLRDFKKFKHQKLFAINSEDFNSLEFVINKLILEKNTARIRKSTIKKLKNLNIFLTTNDIEVNPQFANMRLDIIEDPILLPTFQPVFDLSNLLEKDEIELLGKGLKYGLKNKNFNQFEILARFEEFAQNLDKEEISNLTSNQRYSTSSRDSFLQSFQKLAYDFIDSARTPQTSLTFDEENTLKKLKIKVKENNLIINKADKGNATVVSKKPDYLNKMETLLSDRSKFKIIENPSSDLIAKIEESFNNHLKSLTDVEENYTILDDKGKPFYPIKVKKHLRQKTYQQIRSTGARCGVAYGLTKIHKNENPLRPIISTIGTYNYETSKYLAKVLEEVFSPTFKYVIKDSFDFINKLSKRTLEKDDFLISFDVESLFTNVPID
jgi:hypothetical protein